MIPAAADLFPHARGYLDTASIGLPPTTVATALRDAITDWERGTASASGYDRYTDASRRLFAGLVGVAPSQVAIGPQVSVFTGLVAASLPADAHVLVPEGEFTSVLFPFLVRVGSGAMVSTVPLDRLAERIDPSVDLVAFSAVQSSDGSVADLDGIAEAARDHGALTFVDVTQAAGWLPIDAGRFDLVVAAAYKWLLSPRGTAFLSVRPGLLDDMAPLYAGWYAGADPWASIYGEPLRLAPDARRFDVSPAWLCWVGTTAALELITAVGVQTIHEHDVGLANDLRAHLDLPPSNSAVVSLDVTGRPPLPQGIVASMRDGRLRVCFHLHSTADDVADVAEYLTRSPGQPAR